MLYMMLCYCLLIALVRILWLHQFYTLVVFLSVIMNSWKFSYILKYSPYDIFNIYKRISLILYICPVFLIYFYDKSENFEILKSEKSRSFENISKKIWNLKITFVFEKSEKSPKFWKQKSENLKNIDIFRKQFWESKTEFP